MTTSLELRCTCTASVHCRPGLGVTSLNMTGSEKDKMLSGELYVANDPQLVAERRRAKVLCHRYNQQPGDLDHDTLAELVGYPSDAYVEPPFHCDYGYNIRVGKGFYANHNLIILDGARVAIGDSVFVGPNVVLSSVGHPTDVSTRNSGLEFVRPIKIGDNVWLGASVTILPGVEIGTNVTIGAGSVVTHSIESDCVAVGNPCRVMRRSE